MEDGPRHSRRVVPLTTAERKQLERRLTALGEEQTEWAARAERALAQGEEDMARQALARKLTLAEEQAGCHDALEQATASIARTRTSSKSAPP